MKSQLSMRDWERLTAYLDNQLNPQQRNKIEQRLIIEPDLQSAMQELKRTKIMLRSVRRRKVPYNFTLTAEMVKPRPLPTLFPVLSITSALATVLLVISLLLELMPLPLTGSQRAPMKLSQAEVDISEEANIVVEEMHAEEEAPAEMPAPAAEAPLAEAAEDTMREAESEPQRSSTIGAGESEPLGAAEGAAGEEIEAQPEMFSMPEAEGADESGIAEQEEEVLPEKSMDDAAPPAPETEASPAPLPTPMVKIDEDADKPTETIEKIVTPPSGDHAVPEKEEMRPETPSQTVEAYAAAPIEDEIPLEQQQAGRYPLFWRAAQILFGFIALLSGLVAWRLYKKVKS